jgi:hypothetical protein
MAVGVARWVWQEGLFIGALLSVVAFYGYLMLQGGFDLTGIAAGAYTCLFMVTMRAAQARHPVAVTVSLVLLVVALGVFSAGMMARTGVHLRTIGTIASLYLAVFISVVLQWRRGQPPG